MKRLHSGEEGFCGLAPNVVDDNLKTGLASFFKKGFPDLIRRVVEPNDCVRPVLQQRLQDLLVASSGNNAPRSKEHGDFYSQLSRDASGAEDEDVFTRSQFCAMRE